MFNMCHWKINIHFTQLKFSEVISWIQNLKSTDFTTNIKNVVINKKVTTQFLERNQIVCIKPSFVNLVVLISKTCENHWIQNKERGQCCRYFFFSGRFGMCYLTIIWLVNVISFQRGTGNVLPPWRPKPFCGRRTVDTYITLPPSSSSFVTIPHIIWITFKYKRHWQTQKTVANTKDSDKHKRRWIHT